MNTPTRLRRAKPWTPGAYRAGPVVALLAREAAPMPTPGAPGDERYHCPDCGNRDDAPRGSSGLPCSAGCGSTMVRGEARWHLSVSTSSRYPTWDEIEAVKAALLPGVHMAMPLPPRALWMNLHPFTLHLWEYRDRWMDAQVVADHQGVRGTTRAFPTTEAGYTRPPAQVEALTEEDEQV